MVAVKHYITRATELTAISVARLITEKEFTSTDLLTEEESKSREKLIDQVGVDTMYSSLTDIPFRLEVVGSEGRKHIEEYGEAFPTLEGTFGSSAEEGGLKLDMVNDVVEGSKSAKLNIPGAVSVVAVGKGLLPTPKDTDRMDKLFGPPQLKGRISLDKPIAENLAEAVEVFKVKPSEITVVILERDRNAHYINACQRFGVKLNLIQGRDFTPAVLACMDPGTHKRGIHLLVGVGGFEEGVLAVVAAKALGAVGEGRGWLVDSRKYSKAWTTDQIVKGSKEYAFVSVSAITDENEYFDLKGVREKQGGHEVNTLTVDRSGVNIVSTIHH